ncbi:MAG: hypothetical protein J1E01_01400 [Acetatifactor sp.]|nr:hypothetical protein [Acetatifactor sp.]
MTKDRSKRSAIIRWTAYWLLILGVYIALSHIFGSFEVYLIIPVLAAINFLVRLVVVVPIVKVENPKLKKIFRYLANAVSFAVVLGICGTIMLNGTNYNEAYIASLDYSVFEHRSTVSYNSENGVYTIRAENEELKVLQLTDIHLCASLTTVGADRKALDGSLNRLIFLIDSNDYVQKFHYNRSL